jgi:hypothetical protein
MSCPRVDSTNRQDLFAGGSVHDAGPGAGAAAEGVGVDHVWPLLPTWPVQTLNWLQGERLSLGIDTRA